jgi:SAM-dependent methyltransferase
LGVSERALEVTGQMILDLGLARRTEEGWALSVVGARLQGEGIFDVPGPEALFGRLSGLTGTMHSGEPERSTEIGVVDSDPEHTRTFLEMLYRRSARAAHQTAALLKPLLPPQARVLDLGGGHGRYGEAIRELCGAQITLLDLPISIGVAQDRYGSAQNYIEGDFMDCDLEGPWDAVLLSNIVHGLGPGDLGALLTRLGRCVRPGGLLVLKDMFIGGGCAPGIASSFGMQMLLATREGRSYSVEQMVKLTAVAGFERPSCHPVLDSGFSLLIARLPMS